MSKPLHIRLKGKHCEWSIGDVFFIAPKKLK